MKLSGVPTPNQRPRNSAIESEDAISKDMRTLPALVRCLRFTSPYSLHQAGSHTAGRVLGQSTNHLRRELVTRIRAPWEELQASQTREGVIKDGDVEVYMCARRLRHGDTVFDQGAGFAPNESTAQPVIWAVSSSWWPLFGQKWHTQRCALAVPLSSPPSSLLLAKDVRD